MPIAQRFVILTDSLIKVHHWAPLRAWLAIANIVMIESPPNSTMDTNVLDSELLFGAFKKTMRTEKRSRTRSVSSGSSCSAKRFKVTCNKCGNKISKNYHDTTESSASDLSEDQDFDDLSEDQDDGSACGGLTYRVADQDDADDESDAATSPTTPTTAPSFFSRFG